jgi:hypothetical protein
MFGFHPKCSSIKLTHMCFADDLLIFSVATINSVRTIKGVLDEFENLSGLRANPSNRSLFCGRMSIEVKKDILVFLQMQDGTLPVRHLGVPLITKRLVVADCDILVSKISARIDSWMVKN